ncbi:phage terminase large subunit [uncultured Sphingosinicella sp.]|uniref:phage terminase large subunit n=1 Tax=uncultured Sphingosinicella sp. TaxID=478748 RepID=UPI0030D9177F|tara:strand:+ start:28636 stop:29586 length:951 start_codon:yes stop_codon:yes gene_type:complete
MMEFRLLSFAAIAQEDEEYDYATPFGRRRHVRRAGEALHPEREPLEVLEEQKRWLSSAFFSAQYLQEPVPLEGNLVKRSWLRHYMPFEIMAPDRVIQSWDTASKAGQLNDYSVCTTWGQKDNRIYLLDVVREKLDFPALKRRVIDEADRHGAELVLIEDKGSGIGLLQELQSSGFWKGRAVQPVADKITRLAGVSAMIEGGCVHLPQHALWLEDYVHELCGFPGLRHDDQVDSTSQALAWFREEGNPGGLYHFYRQQHEQRRAYAEDRTILLRATDGISHVELDGKNVLIGPDRTIWVTPQQAGALMQRGFIRLRE